MSDTRSEHRPGRILKYSATLLVFLLLAYAAFLVSQSWRVAKSEQVGQAAMIAALSENSLDIYFTQLQIGMQNLGADLPVTQKKSDLDHAFALVSRFQGLHTELRNVMLIRSDGQILLTGFTANRPFMPSLAEDPGFRKIRDEMQAGPSFAIGQPVKGHLDKSWVVPARYAVTDHAGKLTYIIIANLPVDLLQRYWLDSITPRITALGLVRDDGYQVSRYPEPNDLDKLYGKPGEMAEYLSADHPPQQGQVEIRSGNTTGLMVMRRLQHYPLTLFVEMPVTEIKAVWWHDMHAPYLLMALVLTCTYGFYSLTRRRAWTVEERREELRHNYEHALRERSLNEIYMFDTETLQITYANDHALRNLGYTLEQLQKKTLFTLHPESDFEAFSAVIEPLHYGKQESITYQTNQARKNGSTYPVEVNLQLISAEDGSEQLLAVVHDITARKNAEENILKFNAPLERRAARKN